MRYPPETLLVDVKWPTQLARNTARLLARHKNAITLSDMIGMSPFDMLKVSGVGKVGAEQVFNTLASMESGKVKVASAEDLRKIAERIEKAITESLKNRATDSAPEPLKSDLHFILNKYKPLQHKGVIAASLAFREGISKFLLFSFKSGNKHLSLGLSLIATFHTLSPRNFISLYHLCLTTLIIDNRAGKKSKQNRNRT